MDLNSLENITKLSGINDNYSVDAMKKAAFTDELNNVLRISNHVDQTAIAYYLENRIKEIDRKYK
jgi:hypothetical protein